MSAPKLKRVLRLDAIQLDKTYFTEEGYLIDHPIVTSTGIFEYKNPDGSIRRELRIPEEVFAPESLASYEGKPIIITHDAGSVDKDNVEDVTIGTILSKGYRDGDDVRAKIVIHDTDAMQKCGLRELSLGYNLTLDETPGVWKGQPYDAIQRGIEINHLALVGNARAGKQARLNIDSRDKTSSKGGRKVMTNSKRRDGENMSANDFASAIEAFKGRRAKRMAAKNPDCGIADGTPPAADSTAKDGAFPPAAEDGAGCAPAAKDGDEGAFGASAQDQAQMVKDRRDRRDADGDPSNMDEAMNTIAQQDEDIETLLGIIDAMCAGHGDGEECAECNGDNSDCGVAKGDKKDGEDDPDNADGDDSKSGAMNADSIDAIVRERVKLARIGDRLNIDGLDGMSIMGAKRAIVKKLKPSLRLDGQSSSYVNAAFDLALSEMSMRKDTNFQRRQMFNADSAPKNFQTSGAQEARQKMIARMKGEE